MKMNTDKLIITDIQRFCMHDGPGVRTVVFFKGCPLRCAWCHNPETQAPRPQLLYCAEKCVACGACAGVCPNGAHIMGPAHTVEREKCTACGVCTRECPAGALTVSGETLSVSEIMNTVLRDIPFYGAEGGLTVSGGEPTAQPDGLLNLLSWAKEAGVSVWVETCGMFPAALAEKLAPLTDGFLYDIKDTDPVRLKKYTGAELSLITDNLSRLDALGCAAVLRCVVIPEVNDNAEHWTAVGELYRSLHNARFVELLPYHPYGNSKSAQLGQTAATFTVPARERVETIADTLSAMGVPIKYHGTLRG